MHDTGIPADWSHLLQAMYQVRCNLFHGEKSVVSDIDHQVVRWSVGILLPFLEAAGYLGAAPRSQLRGRE
jgi:hypothetical protein